MLLQNKTVKELKAYENDILTLKQQILEEKEREIQQQKERLQKIEEERREKERLQKIKEEEERREKERLKKIKEEEEEKERLKKIKEEEEKEKEKQEKKRLKKIKEEEKQKEKEKQEKHQQEENDLKYLENYISKKNKQQTLVSTDFLQLYKNIKQKRNLSQYLDNFINFNALKIKLNNVTKSYIPSKKQKFDTLNKNILKLINKTEKEHTEKRLNKIQVLIHHDEITYLILIFKQFTDLNDHITELIQKWKKRWENYVSEFSSVSSIEGFGYSLPFIEDDDDIVYSSVQFGVKTKNEYLWEPFQEEIKQIVQNLPLQDLNTASFNSDSIYYEIVKDLHEELQKINKQFDVEREEYIQRYKDLQDKEKEEEETRSLSEKNRKILIIICRRV